LSKHDPWLLILLCCGCGGPAPAPQASTPSGSVSTESLAARGAQDSITYVRWNLPRLAGTVLARGGRADKYEVFLGLNPYFIRGQFDDDSAIDVAVQIREKSTGKRGVAIIHGTDSSLHVIGAGTPFGNGGDDFSWLWVWRAEPPTARPDISTVGREFLYVEKPESAGGMVWWNGRAYVWTQHGD
jgi:hypothetical protein